MLVEEQIQARRARAKEAIKKVASRPRPGPYGDYRVESTSGAVYRIAMRGPGLFDNYCACPDFARNTLGTCKHIESLLERLRKRHRRALERRGYKRARASVSLEYGETIEVRLRLPDKASPELESLAARYFDPSGLLPRERYGEFEQALEQLRRLDVAAVVYSDAIEYVDRINEFDGGLALESRELRKLERGKLPLPRVAQEPAVSLSNARRLVRGAPRPHGAGRRHGPGQDHPSHRRGRADPQATRHRASSRHRAGFGEIPVAERDPKVQRSVGSGDRRAQGEPQATLRRAGVLQPAQLRARRPRPRADPGARRGHDHPRRSPAHSQLGDRHRPSRQAAQEPLRSGSHRDPRSRTSSKSCTRWSNSSTAAG